MQLIALVLGLMAPLVNGINDRLFVQLVLGLVVLIFFVLGYMTLIRTPKSDVPKTGTGMIDFGAVMKKKEATTPAPEKEEPKK